jgi:hypothetical protein
MKLDSFTSAAIMTGENVIPMMPIIQDGKEVYVMDVVQYRKMRRPYEPRGFHFDTFEEIMRLFRVHTAGSVAEEILQERAKRNGYYAQ